MSSQHAKSEIDTRIAVFAFADIAEYTRLMARDSVGTVKEWARIQSDILSPELRNCGGRVVSSAGDAILVEFSSVISAVNWAHTVQTMLRKRPPNERNMHLRIGINLDDVLDDGDTLQSDGVVLAARIHQLAAPGEVVLTQPVRTIVHNKINAAFRDLGTPPLKNVERPVRVFVLENRHSAQTLPEAPHALWSTRPTLAVLPFRDPGTAEDDRYFGEGITEAIIEGVSRSRTMFVVSRDSALQISDSTKSQKSIAAALGVKYLLSGSIQRQGDRLRLRTELKDIDHNRVLWTAHFDGVAHDLFEFQDQIVANVSAVLEPKVLHAETQRLGQRPTESLDAYDCLLRALAAGYKVDATGFCEAVSLSKRAIELDPNYARAHANLAWNLNFVIAEGYSEDVQADKKRAIEHAARALELDFEDAFALVVRGHIMALLESNPLEAHDLLEDGLRLNGNLPLAWALSATCYAYLGDGAEARERLKNVARLTPYDPLNYFFLAAGGLAEFVDGQYADGIKLLRKAHHNKPHFVATLRLLAASLALAGEKDEAQTVAAELIEQDPTFKISNFMSWYPITRPDVRESFVLGLSAAGLPN